MRIPGAIATIVGSIALSGCTWVKLTGEGEQVSVMNSVAPGCKKLGGTKSISRAEIASIDRNRDKVATELTTLARNHAAEMGGNAIVAEGPVSAEGQQTFAVYKCP